MIPSESINHTGILARQMKEMMVAKVESLFGTTPAEIFQSGLENLEGIEAVATAVLWKDGRVTAGWSNTDIANLSHMLLALDEQHRQMHFRDLED